jgi:hypothetical protein
VDLEEAEARNGSAGEGQKLNGCGTIMVNAMHKYYREKHVSNINISLHLPTYFVCISLPSKKILPV